MPPVNRSSGVRALCSQLGYDETQDKDSPRHFTHLATTVRQFRRINKAYDIPTCAIEFCERAERDMSFFTSSREAKTRGWPVLPNDKDRIIGIVTRLISVQESHSRETERTTRNRNALLGLLSNGKPSEPEAYPSDQSGGSLESSINVETAKETVVHAKRGEIDCAEDAGPGGTRSGDEIEENTQCKSNEHLTWAYPEEEELKHEYLPSDIRKGACTTLDWLFQADPKVQWPDELRSYLWRYMHHQSVYSLAPGFYEIQDLATDLTRHLRITYDPTQFSTIFDKLKHFVAFWTRTWLDYGMLQTGTGSAILRSNDFESKLKSRQTTWLAQREALSESPSKRAGEPVCRPTSNKRQRTYTQNTSTGTSNQNGERVSISRDGSIGVTILDVTDFGSAREPTVQMSPENLQAPLHVSERNNVHMDPPNRKTPPFNGIIAARGAAFVSADEAERHSEDSRGSPTNHIGKPGPIPLPPASKSYGLPSFGIEGSDTFEIPQSSQAPTTTSHVVNQSASREPPKIKLFLQKTDGEIDFQNPLSSREFKEATVPEFFAIFSKRSGLNPDLLPKLTFVVAFSDSLLLQVNRSDDERKWLNLKKRLSYLFKEVVAERPQEEFGVWVVEDSDLVGF